MMTQKILALNLILLFPLLLVQFLSVETASGNNSSDEYPIRSLDGALQNNAQRATITEERMDGFGNNAAIAKSAAITLTEVITSSAGLVQPTDIANAGDGRLFIAEKAGRIRVYDGATVLQTPFLDITSLVASSPSDGGEAGLLGVVFHPNYATNGYLYLNYTHQLSGSTLITRVARYQVSAGNPNIANPAGAVLLEFAQDQGNHNGGDLNFGPNDGYLYISVGDGGMQGDPQNRAQTNTQLLGKILRIDINGTGGADCDSSGNSNYVSPSTNPLHDGPGGNCDEIWANGLRNPWRFSFDRKTGDMWIADVGYQNWEEVNFQTAKSPGGENWGWRCYEGNDAFNTSACGPMSQYDFPVLAYSHGGDPFRCSITGGYVYRGTAVPALTSHYLFADYCSNEFWSLQGSDITTLTSFGLPNIPGGSFARPTTFGEDMNGELYVAENGTDASIFKVTAVDLPCDLCYKTWLAPIFSTGT